MLGHMACAKPMDGKTETISETLPITLPVHDKEMVDIIIALPPIYTIYLEELSMEEVAAIEKNTRKQNMCVQWKNIRKWRFTASKFGYICKRRLYNNAFLKQFIQPDNIGNVPSVAHGVKYEPIAINNYLQINTHVKYFKCGFVIHPYAVHLGASPDGVVYDKNSSSFGILEIKCPCSSKAGTLKEYASMKTFCMQNDQNNILRLKTTHEYYYQVQGQMLLTGLRWADFVIYLTKSEEIAQERILFDPIFCNEMYTKLTNIYNSHMIHCSQ